MSTAIVEKVIAPPADEQSRSPELIPAGPALQAVKTPQEAEAPRTAFSDPYPLLPVFVAGAVSLVLSGGFIATILIWLAVRHSGIMSVIQ